MKEHKVITVKAPKEAETERNKQAQDAWEVKPVASNQKSKYFPILIIAFIASLISTLRFALVYKSFPLTMLFLTSTVLIGILISLQKKK